MKYLKYYIKESINLSNFDKRALVKIIEYVYYNNISDKEDYITLKEIPQWILDGSKNYLKTKNIEKIYRGENNNNHQEPFSWTYSESTAKKFGTNILSKEIPNNVICPEYIAKLVIDKKLDLSGIIDSEALDNLIKTYNDNFENEVIIPLIQ